MNRREALTAMGGLAGGMAVAAPLAASPNPASLLEPGQLNGVPTAYSMRIRVQELATYVEELRRSRGNPYILIDENAPPWDCFAIPADHPLDERMPFTRLFDETLDTYTDETHETLTRAVAVELIRRHRVTWPDVQHAGDRNSAPDTWETVLAPFWVASPQINYLANEQTVGVGQLDVTWREVPIRVASSCAQVLTIVRDFCWTAGLAAIQFATGVDARSGYPDLNVVAAIRKANHGCVGVRVVVDHPKLVMSEVACVHHPELGPYRRLYMTMRCVPVHSTAMLELHRKDKAT